MFLSYNRKGLENLGLMFAIELVLPTLHLILYCPCKCLMLLRIQCYIFPFPTDQNTTIIYKKLIHSRILPVVHS